MRIDEIADHLNLKVIVRWSDPPQEVTGVYISDLLSDVMAHAEEGNLWATLQIHQNIVAVASLKQLAGIILVGGRQPEEETVSKAVENQIPILVTGMFSFEAAGRLFVLLGKC